ncbi:DUF3990 domain-containing protein [Pradoshia sp.]
MRVYHTSNVRVEKPDTHHSRKELDFGPGFYVTTIRQQAENYGARFTRRGEPAWLNIYELKEDWSGWRVKRFDHYDEEWLDFVLQCRSGVVTHDYDIIIGGIADDKVFATLDMYFSGWLPKDEALRRLVFEKPNIQYCIYAEAMLKECLTFIEAIKQ